MQLKKYVYIGLFILLGALLNLLLHVALEYPFLILLANNPAYYEATWIWQHWTTVHRVVNVSLWTIGIVGGYLAGRHFWEVVYSR